MRSTARVQFTPPAPAHDWLPVARPHMPPASAIAPYLDHIDASRHYSNFGPLVCELEKRLAERLGPDAHAVTASSGTSALLLALMALNLPKGSVCALPSWTFVATAHAVLAAGLTPWFIDVDAETAMLDPQMCQTVLSRAPGEVRALIPVCAHGAPLDVEGWAQFQARTGVRVVVDAAAAHDSLTEAPFPMAVSVHATKSLGVGEGGYIVCPNADFALRVRMLSSFGFNGTRESQMVALNAKMSEYAAAVALSAMDNWASTRLLYQQTAFKLRIALKDVPQVQFQEGWGLRWVSSVCVVRVPQEALMPLIAFLKSHHIDSRQWWGDGCHTSRAFTDILRDTLPNTEHLAATTLGLPYCATMDDAQVARLTGLLQSFFQDA
ncbi:aminotransferase class I/II-fold pyridoxal phosphate-dependent enzyme [Asticcacaulis sp. AND118]|uniref:aminotransferase class I/II-fold pyridoxal phosphate-dependent enzyme n=1 Tax=Asticcacaulis sp. AND118 TaxID=2840468 RepID=UPI001CFFCFAC|nr:aminotransferase class I/II-fold pyridoxal phosphate-dependent enzyme [Asticcacaulis sp. AND118]UDF03345.1 aminotransferase class I/II-fold pyridoxal phosphate-dependent enzyme [Asticcacaulis sp. AND118]